MACNNRFNVSIPEPSPINQGEQVTTKLIEFIESLKDKAPNYTSFQNNFDIPSKDTLDEIIQIIKLRDEFGFKKYGQHLMTGDKRNSINDALQEFGDLIQYLYKAKLNNEDISHIKKYIFILNIILNYDKFK